MVGGRERSSLTLTSGGCVSVIWLACAWCRPAREGGLVWWQDTNNSHSSSQLPCSSPCRASEPALAAGTPSPALQPQTPSRDSLTSLRAQGLPSGGRFYSSELSDSSPQGTPGDPSALQHLQAGNAEPIQRYC